MTSPNPQRTLLIVDSNPEIRASLRDVLEDAGYRVLEAGTPSDALTVLTTCPDCLVLILRLDRVMIVVGFVELGDPGDRWRLSRCGRRALAPHYMPARSL